ncbi:MAG: transposase, partial [Burkholderiaceae bacterium]
MNATAALPVVGIDLAKNVFEVAVADRDWRVVERARLSRAQFERWFANRVVGQVVMEACGSAHHCGRGFEAQGIAPTLLPARYVRAYVKRHKTDAADAAALLEACRASDIVPVRVKSVEQQALQALHRTRSLWMGTRTSRINALRVSALRQQCAKAVIAERAGGALERRPRQRIGGRRLCGLRCVVLRTDARCAPRGPAAPAQAGSAAVAPSAKRIALARQHGARHQGAPVLQQFGRLDEEDLVHQRRRTRRRSVGRHIAPGFARLAVKLGDLLAFKAETGALVDPPQWPEPIVEQRRQRRQHAERIADAEQRPPEYLERLQQPVLVEQVVVGLFAELGKAL